MNTFTQYSNIWTKDKQYHFNEFESKAHNADSIDKEIMLYDKSNIHFIKII